MSPLAYSLLALAALLVATDAQDNCNDRIIDKESKYKVALPSIRTPAGGGHITTEDACALMDPLWYAIGQSVHACNYDREGLPPNIKTEKQVDPTKPAPVDIVCVDHCRDGTTVNMVQFCAPVTPQ